MRWIGIDPGASGAVAVLTEHSVDTCRLNDTPHDVAEFLRQWSRNGPCFALLERVSAMPGQGVSSTFKFGTSYGFVQGLLTALQIPFDRVTPAKWQTEMGCRSRGDKNVTKRRAQELYPHLKITHATADAILLATLCRQRGYGA